MLVPPAHIVNDPAKLALFTNADNQIIPDSSVYADWWENKADERRKRIAVGSRKYSLVKQQVTKEERLARKEMP